MRWVGLDIGGANLKASDGERSSVSVPFELWRVPESLAAVLAAVIGELAPAPDGLAVTMTGELADCFATKRDGVQRIVAAAVAAARGRPVAVWQTAGEFVSPDEACESPLLVAAANWHALATWAGRLVPRGWGLLIDIGSTTTDVIPLEDGTPVPVGRTDVERLASQELIYAGVRRTSLCALHQAIGVGGRRLPLAAEFFATTRDVYLLTGDLPEDAADSNTANGRPATREEAAIRIARQMCGDADEIPMETAREIAEAVAAAQSARIADAVAVVVNRMPEQPRAVIVAGEGEFLARRALATVSWTRGLEVTSLSNALGPMHSAAACAFALAVLARERQW